MNLAPTSNVFANADIDWNVINRNKIEAMKRRLNSYDVFRFDNAPDFIVKAFFGQSSYRKRLLVSTFGYLNGIQWEDLLEILQWRKFRHDQMKQIKDLYLIYFEKDEYRRRYYSYDCHRGVVSYLNGALRMHGRRIEERF